MVAYMVLAKVACNIGSRGKPWVQCVGGVA
jgi:hypothetical protein